MCSMVGERAAPANLVDDTTDGTMDCDGTTDGFVADAANDLANKPVVDVTADDINGDHEPVETSDLGYDHRQDHGQDHDGGGRLTLLTEAIDDLAADRLVGLAPEAMLERVAGIWALVAGLDPEIARRRSAYSGDGS